MMEQDFSPENRASGMWSGDARKLAQGKTVQVWMEKTGRELPANLDDVEAVQMGKLLQEPIMRIAADRFDLRFKDAPYEMAHKVHPWMKSHFDYIREDGRWLFEVKNYNGNYARQFDEDARIVPAADRAQCMHEMAVHGVEGVSLIVLFGGCALQKFDLTFSADAISDLIAFEQEIWDKIQADVAPNPHDAEGAKLLWKKHVPGKCLVATGAMEQYAQQLANIKGAIKTYTEQAEAIEEHLKLAMQDAEMLVNFEGQPLATWKASKASQRFNEEAFKAQFPDLHKQYMQDKPGSRRFLVKG